MAKIAIIGTGLIGTSLALALNESQLKDLQVVGTDSDRLARSRAEKRKAFHKHMKFRWPEYLINPVGKA